MIIYLRHASDNYNDPTFLHDQKIVPSKKNLEDINSVVRYLIKTYGSPSVILCSPFQRARDTLEFMKDMLVKETGGEIDVEIDPRLSRYFTSKEKKEPSVRKDTLELEPPIFEKWDDFKERVVEHVDEMVEKGYLKSRHTVVLVITHTLVIKEVAKYLKFDTPEHYEFLQWMCVRSHGPNYKPSFLSHGNGPEDKIIQKDINREKGRLRRQKEKEKRYREEKKKNDIRRGKRVSSSSSDDIGLVDEGKDYDTDDLSTFIRDDVPNKKKKKEKRQKKNDKYERELQKIKQKIKEKERERERERGKYREQGKDRERYNQKPSTPKKYEEKYKGKDTPKDNPKERKGFSIEDHLRQKEKQKELETKKSTKLYGKSLEEIAEEKRRELMYKMEKEKEKENKLFRLEKAKGGSILDFMNVSMKE